MAASENATAPPSRREQIVAIACDLFAEKGFQSVSVREIAERAGILSGSLYTHFKSKTEMLDRGLLPYVEAVDKLHAEIADESATSRERIELLARRSAHCALEHADASRVMFSEWEYLIADDQFSYLYDFGQRVLGAWTEALRAAMADGTLADDIQPETVFALWRDLLAGITRRYNPKQKKTVDTIVDYFLRMLFSGLSAKAE